MGTIFREDVAALLPRLRAYARSLAAGDRSFADDLAQDAVLNALRAQAQFTPGTNLEAWLFTILRNCFRTVVGRRRQRAEVMPEDEEELGRVWWVPAAQEAALDVRAFRQAFRQLGPTQREVLVLHAVRGLTYERIAEITGCEVGTVKSRMNRARAVLKAMMLGETPTLRRRRARERREPPRPAAIPPE